MEDGLIQILKKVNECCGCAACEYVCPKNAISMEYDNEGFAYPQIDYAKCIACRKCINTCAFQSDEITHRYKESGKKPKCYAVVHRDVDVRRSSRSGGIFTALSDYILQDHGVIYGAIVDSELRVIHIRADNVGQRNMMRGSKYVQSDISQCYPLLKRDLEMNKKVLFTGTSCQIAAIKSALGRNYKNLYTVDIVCHGVPSPKIWKDYISYIQEKNKAKCIDVDFRNKKKYGWPAHIETLKLKKENKVKTVDSCLYSKLFYTHLTLRPSCSSCPYKNVDHPGDITIGDYWGIKKAAPDFFSNSLGTSLVLINSESGNELFECIKGKIRFKETDLSLSMQPPLRSSFPLPDNRDTFWSDYQRYGIEKTLLKYVGIPKNVNKGLLKQRIIFLAKRLLGR